jgi:hypothetical protein
MRSGSRGSTAASLLAALLTLAGCGDWSNEDLRFYAALPTRAELHVVVPDAAAPAAAAVAPDPLALVTACGPLGTAETWLWAKPTSDKLNASIDWVIGLIDVVRQAPPTTRLTDGRIWGPFDDDKHPGNEIRIVILRSWPSGPDGAPAHSYAFEARRKAGALPFQPILSGTFVGPSASRGTGTVMLAFDTIRLLGMADPDSPRGRMQVQYDRALEPRSVHLSLAQSPGFGLEQFDYGFVGYADGRGRLEYAFRLGANLITVAAAFDAAGAGRGRSVLTTAGGLTAGFSQCWNAQACLVWVDDPGDASCGRAGCSGGSEAACPVVPAP